MKNVLKIIYLVLTAHQVSMRFLNWSGDRRVSESCIQTLPNPSERGRGSKGFPSGAAVCFREHNGESIIDRHRLISSFTVGLDSAQDCTDNTLSVAQQKYLDLILNIFVIANSQIN